MTTWTLEQIKSARSLRCQARVDTASAEGSDLLLGVRDELYRVLGRMAHTYAIEIHGGDVEFTETPDGKLPWLVDVTCRWRPSTHVIELRGGYVDGDVLEFERAPEPIMVPVHNPPVWESADTVLSAYAALSLCYEVSGWNETERRWVYATRQ